MMIIRLANFSISIRYSLTAISEQPFLLNPLGPGLALIGELPFPPCLPFSRVHGILPGYQH